MRSPTVVDLFSGAGGFGLGFRVAGFRLLLSLEVDQWAADTLRYNSPGTSVIQDDIRRFTLASDIRRLCPVSPDIIIGGPPCQGFSIAGPAEKDPRDPRNSLFREFARWVECLSPRVFVMENVKGILARGSASGERVIDIIRTSFERLGYAVEVWAANAAEYGVPQIRERVFVLGNNAGVWYIGPPPKTHQYTAIDAPPGQTRLANMSPPLPPAISLWEAISDLPPLSAGQGQEVSGYTSPPLTAFQEWARDSCAVLYNHVAMRHSPRLVERFKHVACGQSSSVVPSEHRARTRNGSGRTSSLMYDQNNRRLRPDKPSHTIAASFYANFIHPCQHRNLTAREGARLQSFPDWYRFMGRRTVPSLRLLQREGRLEDQHLCQYNQIGNAVPPLLAYALALHLRGRTQL
jgi:DNA (cytosine-5)-methyltransferase 1